MDLKAGALKRADTDIDAGDDVRSRLQYLAVQSQSIMAQTQFSDAKAAALMTLVGLVAIRGPVPPVLDLNDPLAIGFFGLTAFSILCCLWAVMPRYPKSELCEQILARDKYSWVSIGCPAWSPERHAAFGREADLLEMITAISHANVGGARVLFKKFRTMRVAFIAAIGALLMLGAKLVA